MTFNAKEVAEDIVNLTLPINKASVSQWNDGDWYTFKRIVVFLEEAHAAGVNEGLEKRRALCKCGGLDAIR